ETNDDVSVPRNRVRAELLPFIEGRFNPSIVEVLAEEAELARDEYRWLEIVADHQFGDVVASDGGRRIIAVAALGARPVALQRLIVRRAMGEAAPGRTIRFADVQRVVDLALDHDAPFDGPGQRVERVGGNIVLTGRPAGAVGRPEAARPANLFLYP